MREVISCPMQNHDSHCCHKEIERSSCFYWYIHSLEINSYVVVNRPLANTSHKAYGIPCRNTPMCLLPVAPFPVLPPWTVAQLSSSEWWSHPILFHFRTLFNSFEHYTLRYSPQGRRAIYTTQTSRRMNTQRTNLRSLSLPQPSMNLSTHKSFRAGLARLLLNREIRRTRRRASFSRP